MIEKNKLQDANLFLKVVFPMGNKCRCITLILYR